MRVSRHHLRIGPTLTCGRGSVISAVLMCTWIWLIFLYVLSATNGGACDNTPKDTISYKSLYRRKQHGHWFPFLHVRHPSDRFNSVLLLVRLNSLRPFVTNRLTISLTSCLISLLCRRNSSQIDWTLLSSSLMLSFPSLFFSPRVVVLWVASGVVGVMINSSKKVQCG